MAQPSTSYIQSIVDSFYTARPEAKGIIVHVVSAKEKGEGSAAVGFADLSKEIALRVENPVLIASNTKTYVSATLLRLVEEGLLTLDDPIGAYLEEDSANLLQQKGYDIDSITIRHLLSHRSGIEDYVGEAYMEKVTQDPMHRWTREEQIQWAMTYGQSLGRAGTVFSYADVNYLLLTEIIEHFSEDPFYESIPKWLGFEDNELNRSWFISLADTPEGSLPLATQYASAFGWKSSDIDPSVDLYGGGGIAATMEDLARFAHLFFEGKIVKDTEVLNQVYADLPAIDSVPTTYHLGVSSSRVGGLLSWGHGGFWGTTVRYFPDLETSISIAVLEKDAADLRGSIMEALVGELKKM